MFRTEKKNHATEPVVAIEIRHDTLVMALLEPAADNLPWRARTRSM